MRLDRNHRLGPDTSVYLNGEKQEMAIVADATEGWVDIARKDWAAARASDLYPEKYDQFDAPDFGQWDGRLIDGCPVQRVHGDVRLEIEMNDISGRTYRLNWERADQP